MLLSLYCKYNILFDLRLIHFVLFFCGVGPPVSNVSVTALPLDLVQSENILHLLRNCKVSE